ncbi:NADPH:quinone oxidoreductase family protein [Actinomycetospora termitidis]|uniref:NADPH:quinone oxidoreductase family protein n=1 Tax=Actinomycetospora termitidis TaxID=3053470 RepID=A0ABT7M7M1_9PSEU|nr:NADPH:quinone oxidoreductase family protein [Actinomycetospora sp. Odt1-22]MDL5156660.1 NADPH:quinone oxidoreductase family protein [Actinomycetospora sp. Odt1-22]
MRAVQVSKLEGPEALEVVELDEPVAGEGQVLVDVEAAGVVFPDLLLTRGEYQMRPELPFTLGSEVAGTVRTAPDGSGFAPGDRVAALCVVGGFAETVVAPVDQTFPLPDGVSFDVGAGLPMNYLTAEFVLARRGRLADGETVLVHGAAGGVGIACIQFAKARGATVIAVVSTEGKAEVARAAGADHAVMVEGFKDAALEITGKRGVDVVVDPVGGDRFTDSLRSLNRGGRLVVVGFTGGDIPTVKVNRLLLRNTEVVGAGWGEWAWNNPGFMRGQWDDLADDIAAGRLAPPVSATYPLAQATAAVNELAERRVTGKVVVHPRG